MAFRFTTKSSHLDLKDLNSLSSNFLMSSYKLCKISFLNLTICSEFTLIVLHFLRELSVSLPGDAKAIVKLGIGVTGLNVANLFENIVGIFDIVKRTGGKVPVSFIGVFKKFSWR